MDTLQSMKVFRSVVDGGSFVAAARALDVSTAMASKHVAHLEKRLGTRLLNRSSRHLSLTDAGRVYFEQVRDALDNLESAELAVGQTAVAPRGVLKITAPVWFANAHFARLLSAYRARYPDVVLDVSLSDRVVDLVEEGFDLALRVDNQSRVGADRAAAPYDPLPLRRGAVRTSRRTEFRARRRRSLRTRRSATRTRRSAITFRWRRRMASNRCRSRRRCAPTTRR